MTGKRWTQLPLRTCITRHDCALQPVVGQCDGKIVLGQTFRDGGKGKRAHERCVRVAAEAAEAADSTSLQHMSSALAAGLFGARLDRTTRGRN